MKYIDTQEMIIAIFDSDDKIMIVNDKGTTFYYADCTPDGLNYEQFKELLDNDENLEVHFEI